MFDLFRRRDTTMRYVLMGLLGLVALSMVITLIPGFGGPSGPSQTDQLLAEVNGEPITIREAGMRVEQQLRASGLTRQNGFLLANTVVDQLVAQKSAEYLARRMGFRVTEEDMIEGIRTILPQAFPSGQFVGKQAYGELLAQRGMTIPDFESRLRTQLLLQRVGNLVDESVVVTPAELEAEFHRQNDKVKIEYVAIRDTAVAARVTVSDAELRAEYDKNKANYKVPEKRASAVLFVDEQKTATGLTPNEADLRRAYQEQQDRFRTTERLKVRHILLKTTGMAEPEMAKVQARAEDLLKKIKAGGDFAALAKANSDDPGSAQQGGDLGFITRGQTVKNFEEAAFNLKPGELSNVVKTEYGFHILQLMGKEDARVRPFEEVRAELVADTQRQVVFDKMQRDIDALRAELVKDPNAVEQKAAQHGAEVIRTSPMTQPESAYPVLGQVPELTAQIFTLKKGEVTSVVQAGTNRLAIAVVTDIQPERPAAFEDVAAQIRKSLTDSKQATIRTQLATEVRGEAQKPGSDLKKLAAEKKLEYKVTPEFNRNGAAEGLGAGELLSEVFGKPAGFVPQNVGTGDTTFVVRVVEAIPASADQLAAQRDALMNQVRQQRGRERGDLFQDGLVQKLTKEGKVKTYPDNLKRFLAAYGASS